MLGIRFMGEVPFRRVVFNALVRDAEGLKMSKTKGNGLDPLELIDEYGCDPVRLTLTALSGQSRDIRLSRERFEGYRNFGTKLWNAARFCQMNGCAQVEGFDPGAVQSTLNRWIRGEATKTIAAVTDALDACAFAEAAGALYRFIWNVFCDWYVELAKPILAGDDEAAKAETRAMAAWTLRVCLKLLHPISPFMTETLWGDFSAPAEGLLISAAWPEAKAEWIDAEAAAELEWLIDLVDAVRSIRADTNVPAGARAPLVLVGAGPLTRVRLERHRALIERLARLSSIDLADAPPSGSVQFVAGEATGALPLAGLIDIAGERTRLAKEIATLAADAEKTAKKLANADFVARAPEEVVEENRERLAGAEAAIAKLQAALERLKSVA